MANNWKETCARCMEGDVEPRYCEYYGEPNGCNSPIYGEHPSTPNAVAMRSCLIKILAEMIDLGGMERGRKACFSPDAFAEEIRQALAVPPRNCDRPECATTKAAQDVWHREDGGKTAYYEWLLATATEKKGGNDGN